MLKSLYHFFSSLKLTVVLLALGIILIFLGTFAQQPLGLYTAQTRFFKGFFVEIGPMSAAICQILDILLQGFGGSFPVPSAAAALAQPHIPVFPGGYTIGGMLFLNLFVAHFRYYQPGKRKIGIMLIHLGIVLLLFGQMLTDFLSRESAMHLRIGETKNYSEAERAFELAVLDTTDRNADKVVAIPCSLLVRRGEVGNSELPFRVRVKAFYPNSALDQKSQPGYEPVKTTAGYGAGFWWRNVPRETEMNRLDMPSGIIEIVTPQGSLGSLLVSSWLEQPQTFAFNNHNYELRLRQERFYLPFSLHLIEFRHDKYPGTDIPKNFSSRVRLQNPRTGEDREVRIFMNNPLRYAGETFYQASFDPDDHGSVLQVVHNPSWVTPYLACVLVATGLVIQFLSHLIPFLKRRRAQSQSAGVPPANNAARGQVASRRDASVPRRETRKEKVRQ